MPDLIAPRRRSKAPGVVVIDRERNRNIESAEAYQEAVQTEQRHNAYALKEKWMILRFYCFNCHKPHFWGGLQRDVGAINYSDFCPRVKNMRDYRKIWLEVNYLDVPERDALEYKPKRA